jgi:hypothetical protein
MTKFLVATVSTLAFASAAFAADMPTRQPPPPAPVVGKAPIPIIGKLPVVGTAILILTYGGLASGLSKARVAMSCCQEGKTT